MGLRVTSLHAQAAVSLDPLQLVMRASFVVKSVLGVLVCFSLLCWFVIGMKSFRLYRVRSQAALFFPFFERVTSLAYLYQAMLSFPPSPFARVVRGGLDEVKRNAEKWPSGSLTEEQKGLLEAAVRRAALKEMDELESWLGVLGTISSTAPFVGLLGTVYGIMNAFLSMGHQQNVGLSVVAPSIAEALIATAAGLVAALPSVVAYNYFQRCIRKVCDMIEDLAMIFVARARAGSL